jgi:hypothetical protein
MSSQSMISQIDRLDPQTCSVVSSQSPNLLVVSSRSQNLQMSCLGPQTCSVVSFWSTNLILNLIWVKPRRSKYLYQKIIYNFSYKLKWRQTLYQNCSHRRDLQLCSWKVFELKLFRVPKIVLYVYRFWNLKVKIIKLFWILTWSTWKLYRSIWSITL